MEFQESQLDRYVLHPGDLLITEGGVTVGRSAIWNGELSECYYQNSLNRARVLHGSPLSTRYLLYWMQYATDSGYVDLVADKATFGHLTNEKLKAFPLVSPPTKEEQLGIVAFLDRETAQIDTLIAKQERLIALLQEKRQALISHAVTKGLNPAMPMKESGVAWLGQVPAHWEVVQLRRVLVAIEQGQTLSSDNRLAEADEWAVLKSGCVNRGIFRADEHKALAVKDGFDRKNEVQVGDLLMSRASGSIELVGSVALVRKTRSKLLLSDKTFRLVPAQDVDREFLALQLNASHVRAQIEQTSNGAEGLPNNITKPAINALWVALPPVAEQVSLVPSLSHLLSKIDAMSERLVRSVALLQERRSALISAAVTGKIDAREHL